MLNLGNPYGNIPYSSTWETVLTCPCLIARQDHQGHVFFFGVCQAKTPLDRKAVLSVC